MNYRRSILREKPVIHIGKRGLHENLIKKILCLIEKRKIIKIRVLRNFLQFNNLDRKEFFENLKIKFEKYKIKVIDIRGYTAILYKKN